ncbi:C40 family peptidase [[Clostridium] aminophilum]|uniref:C40 family peptidase n=1 Tax=[Clostridium] aminophilum TaxID=1526 RepID=UPI003F958624
MRDVKSLRRMTIRKKWAVLAAALSLSFFFLTQQQITAFPFGVIRSEAALYGSGAYDYDSSGQYYSAYNYYNYTSPSLQPRYYKPYAYEYANEEEYTTEARQKLVEYALQFVGKPYVWGGTSLDNGVDCSGFVQQIFGHFGIATGRTSRDQYRNCIYLYASEVMPGDLIFYAKDDYINHVAVYIGNGLICHAASAKSGVKVSRYDYRHPYAYGRFVMN